METLVSTQSKQLIQFMLAEPKISERVLENIADKDKYKICTIQNDGTIVLGKTSVRWWNRLLNCQDTIPFESLALKIWDALVDNSSGLNNKAIIEGLSREIVMSSVRKKDYNWTVNRLFDCCRHVAQHTDMFQSNALPEGGSVVGDQGVKTTVVNAIPTSHNIIINVDGVKRTIPIIDSIGDPLNVGLEVGITGIRRL